MPLSIVVGWAPQADRRIEWIARDAQRRGKEISGAERNDRQGQPGSGKGADSKANRPITARETASS